MKLKNIFVRFLVVLLAALLAFSGSQTVLAQSGGSQSLTGWFGVVWGDGRAGEQATVFTLTDDSGKTTTPLLDDSLAAAAGGILALNRQRVTIHSVQRSSPTLNAVSALQVDSIALEKPQTNMGIRAVPSLVSGSQPFVSIMCQFSDIASAPKDLAYFTGMYGSSYPGLDDYWRQASYNTVNIVGSGAAGWFTLPYPRSHYIVGGAADLRSLAADCTAAADPTVDFSPFLGVNMMFNSVLNWNYVPPAPPSAPTPATGGGRGRGGTLR